MARPNVDAEFELDRVRKMRLSVNAMKLFKAKTGKDIAQGFDSLDQDEIFCLMWVSLLHDDPDLTEEAFGEIATLTDILRFSENLGTLLIQSLPESEEGISEGESKNVNSSTG